MQDAITVADRHDTDSLLLDSGEIRQLGESDSTTIAYDDEGPSDAHQSARERVAELLALLARDLESIDALRAA